MGKMIIIVIPLLLLIAETLSIVQYGDWKADMNKEKWNQNAKERIDVLLKRKINRNIAKNIVFFLGDGMGASTVTAGRILKGQLNNRSGEEEITVMESLDNAALSKTYNIDAQTADSAGTATAYLSGVKTRIGVIGVDGTAAFGDCKSSLNAEVDSILQWAYKAGKSVGIVTTTRITHATPCGAYGHTPNRNWEAYDGRNFGKPQQDLGCKDIAAQLVDDHPYINVIIGGGRKYFLSTADRDPCSSSFGLRTDGRNLIDSWSKHMQDNKLAYKFACNATDFRNVDPEKVDHLFGLMAYDHLEYELDRNNALEPSLSEMTEKAIKILSKNKNGFFLLVEGGKIDHAHHDSKARYALRDFVAFDEAIGKSLTLTSEADTTTLVTADHSHTFSIGGYAVRGNQIYGIVYSLYGNYTDDLTSTFTALGYANGPGGLKQIRLYNLSDAQVANKNYVQESAVYLGSETHGGEDVPIYAHGPMSFLFDGTVEQSYIPHALAYAACIGKYDTTECRRERGVNASNSITLVSSTKMLNAFVILTILFFKIVFN